MRASSREAPAARLSCAATAMVRPPGAVTLARTVAVRRVAERLATCALSVRADVVTPGVSSWTTWASVSDTAPEVCSCTGNWIPVLLSGGIWVQSTLSSVNIFDGSLGCTRSATALTPERIQRLTSKLYCVKAPWTVACEATSCPLR